MNKEQKIIEYSRDFDNNIQYINNDISVSFVTQ